jgi:hypothetical protein
VKARTSAPWWRVTSNIPSLAFLPNGDLLFTERTGRLRVLRGGKLDRIDNR